MLQVMQRVMGLPCEKLWAVGSGFGGGVGRSQSMCGALLGGVAALGLHCAESGVEAKAVARTVRPKVQELLEGFAAHFGATDCGTLIDLDFTTPGWQAEFKERGIKAQRCDQYTKWIAVTLAEWAESGKLTPPST